MSSHVLWLALCRFGLVQGLLTVLCALAAGWPGATLAASPAPLIESVGTDVIARDVVAALAQDRHGFLWVATGDGLVRHDGIEFRAQELPDSDPARRSVGWVRALLPARDGRLWVGTESQGLAVHDPASGRLKRWPIAVDAEPSMGQVAAPDAPNAPARALPQIQALAEDIDGAIWVGYRGEGLVRIDLSTGAARRLDDAGLPDGRVEALLFGRNGVLWVGTWRGLSRRLPGAERVEAVPLPGPGAADGPARTVQALLEDAQGRIWAGTREGDLLLVDGGRGPLRTQRLVDGLGRSHGAPVTSLAQARDGTVWVGRANGIDLHAADGRPLASLRHEPGQVGGLAADEVTSLIVDRAGWVWIGGIGLGLQRHNPANRDITLVGIAPALGQRPREVDVRGLLVRPDGQVWVSTLDEGVSVLDADLRLSRRVNVDPGTPTGARETVVALAEAGAGSTWLATGTRLILLDAAGQVRRSVVHGAGLVHALRVGPGGTLWVGAQGGLHRLDADATALAAVLRSDGVPLGGDVYVLAEAPDRSLWVGGLQGLHQVQPGGARLLPVLAAEGHGLGSPVVIDLLFDAQGVLWVDTAVAGLHRMTEGPDGPDGRARFDRVSQRLGIVGKPFGSNLLQDRRGRIWTHLHVHDPQADRIDTLTAVDGVRIGNGRFRVKGVLPDGRLLFGGTKGLLAVRAEAWDRSTDQPPLVVTSLRIHGQPQVTGPLPAVLKLASGERDLAVEFAALDLSESRRLRYRYRLEGHDDDWLDTRADLRVASYGNLWPGDYLLRVQATNRSGVWSAQELAIRLRVEPSWWQTWAFGVVAVLLVLAAASLAWQLRTRALRLRHDELEALVRQRTAALETMSHELQQRSAALEAASLVDPLTGLHNRRYLTEQIDALVAQAIRRHDNHRLHGTPLGEDADLVFFLVDIDHFKEVNDQHGHAAGDAVLRQMRARLQQVFRAGDHLVRWGGEEFLVVAVGTSRAGAELLAERTRAAVADRPFVLDDGSVLSKTCSIGYACLPLAPVWPRALDWQQVLNVADAALYAVKGSGRDGWMGVIQAETPSVEDLQARLRLPLDGPPGPVVLTLRRRPPTAGPQA
ncbi:ligand-binding sensor domain-containing diguanylate cyclase [Sphaerotilus mobilis]|uniref:diguanylate cyclase n=1 Tax=Sphaerotilus mobilis TaxID=47994 RepID=A0A4Q7LR57_9BURK|nr:ligand-binding sensor domain-containing diguanylate cyclase [Sphaerotilus mobilis]RZS56901.1 diguanylate cyclase (GGDEF)-like protein [Sphaerotilus mobilis]